MVQKGPKSQKSPIFFQAINPQNKTKKWVMLNWILSSGWKNIAYHRCTHTHPYTHTHAQTHVDYLTVSIFDDYKAPSGEEATCRMSKSTENFLI